MATTGHRSAVPLRRFDGNGSSSAGFWRSLHSLGGNWAERCWNESGTTVPKVPFPIVSEHGNVWPTVAVRGSLWLPPTQLQDLFSRPRTLYLIRTPGGRPGNGNGKGTRPSFRSNPPTDNRRPRQGDVRCYEALAQCLSGHLARAARVPTRDNAIEGATLRMLAPYSVGDVRAAVGDPEAKVTSVLRKLVAGGKLVSWGQKRGTKYRVVETGAAAPIASAREAEAFLR